MRRLKANFPKYLAQLFELTHETFMRRFPVNFHPMRSQSLLQYFRAIINQLIGFESCNFSVLVTLGILLFYPAFITSLKTVLVAFSQLFLAT